MKPADLIQLETNDPKVEELVREFLNFEDDDIPICESCDNEYEFSFDYSENPGIKIVCAQCGEIMFWEQNPPIKMWQELHLDYFMERYLEGESIQCPFDDCQVSVIEYADDLLEFRCLFCNRRGRKDRFRR